MACRALLARVADLRLHAASPPPAARPPTRTRTFLSPHSAPAPNPCRPDYSDLVQQVEWARTHDRQAAAIAAEAVLWVNEGLKEEDLKCYLYRLLLEYGAVYTGGSGNSSRGGSGRRGGGGDSRKGGGGRTARAVGGAAAEPP